MAYPGYVFHQYPKMIYDKKFIPLGYVIVASEEEELKLFPKEVKEPKTKSKLKFDMEE